MADFLDFSDFQKFLADKDLSSRSLAAFTPPPRFTQTSFSNYLPQDPSQEKALAEVQGFVAMAQNPPAPKNRGWFRAKEKPQGKGLYLDGGFGVGKTHLLAASYHQFKGPKAYLSFQELVHMRGALGQENTLAELAKYHLICIDEFELDDPGNTLMVKTMLAHVFSLGHFVITTSNTPPAAQGLGRFNAEDFRREIQSIAEHFQVLRVDGPDYRKRSQLASLMTCKKLQEALRAEEVKGFKLKLTYGELKELLFEHHPIRYGQMLEGIGALYLEDLSIIPDQNSALRFVHLIDKLYDLKLGLRVCGDISLDELFDASYVNSAYAKKHFRCLSRLSELLEARLSLKELAIA
ncbi:MAG: cell division protein ZapE [Deinococcales bacterium]